MYCGINSTQIVCNLSNLKESYKLTPLCGFPLGEMSGDFAAKFIWACAFLFVYSLAGEIFLFKIIKMDLTNSRRKNSPQFLTNQNTNPFQSLLYQQIHFNQIKSKVATNNMSNVHLQLFFQLDAIAAG